MSFFNEKYESITAIRDLAYNKENIRRAISSKACMEYSGIFCACANHFTTAILNPTIIQCRRTFDKTQFDSVAVVIRKG